MTQRILAYCLGATQMLSYGPIMTHFGVVDRIEKRVTALVTLVAKQHDIPTEHLLTASLVDGGMTSMAILDLLLAAESEFDLIIPEHELTPHNFTDVASLTALMSRLKSPGSV